MAEVSKAAPQVRNLAVFIDADNLSDATALDHSQSALRILERYPQSFEVNLSHHPQTVRHIGPVVV